MSAMNHEAGLNKGITRRDLLKGAAAGAIAGIVGKEDAHASSSELPQNLYEFTPEGTFSTDYLGFTFSAKINPNLISAESPHFIRAVQTNPPTWISPDPSLSDQSHEIVNKIVFNAQTTPSKYSTQSEFYAITPREGQSAKEYSASALSHIVKNGGEVIFSLPRTLDKARCEGREISANIPGNNPDEPYFNFMGTYFELEDKIVCITMETTLDQNYYYGNVDSYWEALSSFEPQSNR